MKAAGSLCENMGGGDGENPDDKQSETSANLSTSLRLKISSKYTKATRNPLTPKRSETYWSSLLL